MFDYVFGIYVAGVFIMALIMWFPTQKSEIRGHVIRSAIVAFWPIVLIFEAFKNFWQSRQKKSGGRGGS